MVPAESGMRALVLALLAFVAANVALCLVLAIPSRESRDEDYERWLASRTPARERR